MQDEEGFQVVEKTGLAEGRTVLGEGVALVETGAVPGRTGLFGWAGEQPGWVEVD